MSAVAAAAPSRLDRRGLGVLSFGHLSVDLAQGTVPALLPFLVRDRGYSYAAAGALLLFSSIGSSFLQPLLGAFADRIRAGWMMPVGTLLAATGVALSGQFDSYLATGGVLVISSIGVAMYHPEAVRFASYVSVAGGRQGTGMSMFAVGGLSGWALGPILTTPVVGLVGLRGTAIVALVPLAATLLSPPTCATSSATGRRSSPGTSRARTSARATGRRSRSPRPPARCAPARSSASRPSSRSTSGARWTRARASATSPSPRCSPPARSARCSAAGSPTCTASAA